MLSLRKATYEDCYLLFEWTNEDEVRNNSFTNNKVDIETHKIWLINKLQDENTQLYVILNNNCDVGVVRIDKKDEDYIISYSIGKEFRGKGLGKETLIYIKDIMNDKRLVGLVKNDNMISIKAFESAGYKKIMCKDFIKFVSI